MQPHEVIPAQAASSQRTWLAGTLPIWLTHWEFWLVLGIGAVLRLVALGHSPFGSDDSLLFLEAARAAHEHILPATGIYNSLLALNMPMYTYLLLPFADHPMGMVILTGMANVAAVGAAYLLMERFFSRQAALWGGILFATASYATWMSEFIWQQTIVIPFTIAVLWLVYLGVVEGRRFWLAPHLILLSMLIQIYPIAASLTVLTVVGAVLAWKTIRPLDVAIGVLGSLLLFLPTILFERASGGIDLAVYRQYLSAPKHTDTQVFTAMSQALGPRPADYLGGGTLYFSFQHWTTWLTPAMMGLWGVSTLWLAVTVLRPIAPLAVRGKIGATWTAMADARWRAELLLLLWPIAFLATTVRHSSPVYVHYAFVITPVIYMTDGLFLATTIQQLSKLTRRAVAGRVAGWLVRISAAVLAGAQFVGTALFIFVLTVGQGQAGSWAGISMPSFAHSLSVASAKAASVGAKQVYVVGGAYDPFTAQYLSERQNDLASTQSTYWTSYVSDECALTPPQGGGPGLILSTVAPGIALSEVLREGIARELLSIPMARGAAFPLYEVNPATPSRSSLATVNGELRLDSTTVSNAANGLPARVVTHWTVLSALAPGYQANWYRFHMLFSGPKGAYTDTWATCAPTALLPGEGITVVKTLPSQVVGQSGWHLGIIVARSTHAWYTPKVRSLGAAPLESAKEIWLNDVVLPLGTRPTAGTASPDQATIDRATIDIPLLKPST